MPVLPALERTQHWRQYLLQDALHPELPAVLPDFLKHTGRAFLAHVPDQLDVAHRQELDRWYWSPEGQETLAAIAFRLWADMASLSEHAMPAHDARHAMFKVPAMSLEYVVSENVHGWERVGILGGLLHDYGRWAEERVFGEPCDSMIHARLSYLLGKELLDKFEMPAAIRQQILLAAIRHTSGATPEDPMPLKLTVSADRDQLYGAEIVLRLAHHMVNPAGDMGSFYGEKPGLPVLTKLENFLFNRLPGPLYSRQAHVDSLWWSLANFILMSEDADASRERFRRRLDGSARAASRLLNEFEWEAAWEQADELRRATRVPDADYAMRQLLSAPNVAPAARYLADARQKVTGLPAAQSIHIAGALHYIHHQRIAEDNRQLDALRNIARTHADDALVQTMASLLIADWDGYVR
jgi:hypothetical protein